jgi:hypothetical protein
MEVAAQLVKQRINGTCSKNALIIIIIISNNEITD